MIAPATGCKRRSVAHIVPRRLGDENVPAKPVNMEDSSGDQLAASMTSFG